LGAIKPKVLSRIAKFNYDHLSPMPDGGEPDVLRRDVVYYDN
jgi:hypothetical protein